MVDITEVIAHQHEEQRRLFSYLEQWPADDTEGLGAVWRRLAILLEIHADAEEQHFFPVVLEHGVGQADAEGIDEEVVDALGDHNEIRDAIRKADAEKVGTSAWWEAVTACNVANSNHMGEEERQDLTELRRRVSLQQRHDIAVAFLRQEALHAAEGVPVEDVVPEEYVERGGPDQH